MAAADEWRDEEQLYEEKDFYLEEFRGRSVLIAASPDAASGRRDLAPLARAVSDLVRNGTRVVVWWPSGGLSERRLYTALRKMRLRVRRRATRHHAASVVRLGADGETPSPEAVRAAAWAAFRRARLAVIVPEQPAFPDDPVTLARVLGVPKLVLLDPRGGLLGDAPNGRLSFVDLNLLDTLLLRGEAEWGGLGDRRALLVGVRDGLLAGLEAVNLCTPEGVGDELFTYVGAGTLFTESDYCHVAPLGLEDLAQAERLLERGQREGVLKRRTPDEIAEILAVGFGARFLPRHLAGVAGLLTMPYVAERAGEIVGLYTITRFKGEGLGERLVGRLLQEAERLGLAYVFACAVDARACEFFARLGFERVGAEDVPPAKWEGYDARRRARVAVFRRRLTAMAVRAAHGG
jgi:amino-acid N-acetyltransferase